MIFSSGIFNVFADDDPPAPPDPPETKTIEGTVYQYEYGKSQSTATAKGGIQVSVAMKSGSKNYTSGNDGKFSATLTDEEATETGKHAWNIAKNADHAAASGTLTENESGKLYVEERYVPKASDWDYVPSENVINGVIRCAGTYAIKGTGTNKLSKTLDGEASSTINVNINANGDIDSFYVYPSGADISSKVLSGQKAVIDDKGPVIGSVTTTAADGSTYVKTHGIYSKTKAGIIVRAEISEPGCGLDKVYIVGKKGGTTTTYDTVKVTGQQDSYKAEIALPDEETIMDARVMYLVAIDKFGNRSTETLIAQTQAASSVTLELIAPTITHTVTPDPNEKGWYKSLPTITANVTDPLSGLASVKIYQGNTLLKEVSYDDKETEEKTISAAAVSASSPTGAHTIRIVATDNAGNEAEDSFQIKLDLGAPKVTITGAENGAYYAAVPEVVINEDEAYYSADGNVITASVTRAGSSDVKNFTASAKNKLVIPAEAFNDNGRYTVTANATDAAGNKAETKSITFIKDSTAPTLTLAATKDPNKHGWYNALPSVKTTAQDGLSGLSELTLMEGSRKLADKSYPAETVSLQQLTGKSFIDTPSETGEYTFSATATDHSGNSSSKTIKLKIDLVAPILSASGVTSGTHYSKSPTINISLDEKYYKDKASYIRYAVSRDGKEIVNKTFNGVNGATVPAGTFSKDGHYVVTINAADAAGNTAKSLKYSFTKDATAPVVKLSGAANGRFYNKAQTITLEVVEANYKTDTVKTSINRKLGNKSNTSSFPWSNKGVRSTSTKRFAESGTYTIKASATDKAGNSSGEKKLTFSVDTKAPVIKISGVQKDKVYKFGEAVSPKVDVTDDFPDKKTIVYTKAGKTVTNPSFGEVKENDGQYTLTVTATDKAGNTSRQSLNFTINRFGSFFTYDNNIKELNKKAVQNVDTDLVITEKNVSKVKKSDMLVSLDGKTSAAEARTDSNETGAEKTYKHIFAKSNFDNEGAYEINVVSKDEAGNEMESKDDAGKIRFYVDRTPPSISISGIDPKGNVGETVSLTVNVNETLTGVESLTATVNDEERDLTRNDDGTYTLTVGEGMRQKIYISATDKAGNSGTAEDTISVSTSSTSLFLNRYGIVLGIIALLAIIGCIVLILLLRSRNRDDDDYYDEQQQYEQYRQQ